MRPRQPRPLPHARLHPSGPLLSVPPATARLRPIHPFHPQLRQGHGFSGSSERTVTRTFLAVSPARKGRQKRPSTDVSTVCDTGGTSPQRGVTAAIRTGRGPTSTVRDPAAPSGDQDVAGLPSTAASA